MPSYNFTTVFCCRWVIFNDFVYNCAILNHYHLSKNVISILCTSLKLTKYISVLETCFSELFSNYMSIMLLISSYFFSLCQRIQCSLTGLLSRFVAGSASVGFWFFFSNISKGTGIWEVHYRLRNLVWEVPIGQSNIWTFINQL